MMPDVVKKTNEKMMPSALKNAEFVAKNESESIKFDVINRGRITKRPILNVYPYHNVAFLHITIQSKNP